MSGIEAKIAVKKSQESISRRQVLKILSSEDSLSGFDKLVSVPAEDVSTVKDNNYLKVNETMKNLQVANDALKDHQLSQSESIVSSKDHTVSRL